MPLTLAAVGENGMIRHIGGSAEVKRRLENPGFVVGGTVQVISRMGGNLIINVKDSRVAIDEMLARKIQI